MATISTSPGSRIGEQRRGPRIDPWLILSAIVLVVVGLMSLYSEGANRDGGADFRKQVAFALIGIVPFTVFAVIHPKFWLRASTLLYGINVLSLSAVLVLGSTKKGAERWIDLGPIQFQPSELAKLLTVLTLAAFYANRQESVRSLSTFLLSFLHILPILALILLQPHLGAAMVIVVLWFAISLVGGAQIKHLGVALAIFVTMATLVLTVPAVSSRVLHGYQQDRLPGLGTKDSTGKNWQTARAEIAFGVGGVVGTGYLKGEQKAGHFIPEQHNDFVFTIVGEEGGLVGCTMVLAAFGFFFYRIWVVMFNAVEPFYKMIAAGIFAALFFHTFVNIAMVLHIVPVVGLWLPFLSYGGTALWLCMACVGLMLNVRRREKPLLF
ncbi:FtsW/RodA/SpoVE family cell cycle protein [Fimbriimonas ginsengisoli]|uniref:Rod shape-determining protein RodA n=1 Tax=Fimbriimonas ginsengisoli Gsoil 348 TaxID=661478 RepID=A0A068NSA5_FIMGI|nr:FtsW/RodA/SpoVE family cell cycle protein [Fimbriimonas ginsengisoli]AIE86428.1 rod shape-determining protein RodA [Fimbriimonas ginsengisoli Gsoil 348]